MTQHIGFLWADFGDGPEEILNNARTMAHLANSNAGCARVSFHGAECAVLSKNPSTGSTLTFGDPDTNTVAPWWDGVSNSPSSKALGFWVEAWTGIDSGHIKRSAAAVSPRGARMSKIGQGARVMKFNVVLFGLDEVALEELFRWLETKLSDCSNSCFGMSLWFRTVCPGTYGNDTGLVITPGGYLMEGLQWLDPPIKDLGCFMRRATFTLGVSDPCLYTKASEIMALESFSSPTHCSEGIDGIFGCPEDVDNFSAFQLDAAITGTHVGVRAPVVYIANTNVTYWSTPLTVIGVEDPTSLGAVVDGNVFVGQVWLRGVPPNTEVMVDCARRKIMKRIIGDTVWESADETIDGLKGIPSYPSFTEDGWVIVRPTFLGNNMADIDVHIDAVQRYGCC